MITYEIYLPASGNNFGFNLLNDEYFTILFITDTIPNSLVGHQLPEQSKQKVWIIKSTRKIQFQD